MEKAVKGVITAPVDLENTMKQSMQNTATLAVGMMRIVLRNQENPRGIVILMEEKIRNGDTGTLKA
jgi:hypothetical protein